MTDLLLRQPVEHLLVRDQIRVPDRLVQPVERTEAKEGAAGQ